MEENKTETQEEIIYNKIYARADESGRVIRIYSEAFEESQEGDICIDETNTDRHGAQAYRVIDENGIYNYEIKSGGMRERDKTSEQAELEGERLSARYIPSRTDSLAAAAKLMLKTMPELEEESKLAVSGLYETWREGKYEIGEIRNHAGQTWECIQAHDNAEYPDIRPDEAQTWAVFWRPLHGKSAETARPWVKPRAGTTDMYRAGEYMIYSDGKLYECLSDTVYSPDEYAPAWEAHE